jgi:hypothetical protein
MWFDLRSVLGADVGIRAATTKVIARQINDRDVLTGILRRPQETLQSRLSRDWLKISCDRAFGRRRPDHIGGPGRRGPAIRSTLRRASSARVAKPWLVTRIPVLATIARNPDSGNLIAQPNHP